MPSPLLHGRRQSLLFISLSMVFIAFGLKDTQRIRQGVIVLHPGWKQLLENNKQAYALEF